MKMFRTTPASVRSKMYCSVILIAALIATTRPVHTTPHALQDPILQRLVTLTFTDLTFEKALLQIEQAAAVRFFYSAEQLNVRDEISLHVTNITLGEVLDQLLKPHDIQYRVHPKEASILLKRNTVPPHSQSDITPPTQPQRTLKITGTVRDQKNQQAMPGVSVLEKNTMNGTATDTDGSFSIQAAEDAILIFSFIGFVTREVRVNGQAVLEVMLLEDAKTLDAVVVNAGYYEVNDRERTGNISRIEAKDIQKQPVSNPIATLQGRMAGVEVLQQTGVPGGNFQVRIRGTNSIANGNDPLYIIDGVPFTSASMAVFETSGSLYNHGTNPLNAINPMDIESIEVLKDADATAIYGSRGSNGVILITTKKGQAHKTKIDINFYSGMGDVPRHMKLLNTPQYLQMRKEAFANDNRVPTVSTGRDLTLWDTTKYTNWQKTLIGGTAHMTDAQMSFSGGNTNTQFVAGGGYHRETTVFPGDNADERISSHVSVNHASANNKFRASFGINYTLNNATMLRQDLTARALSLPPVAPAVYDEQGNISWENWSNTYENPLAFTKRMYEANTTNLLSNSVISYNILPTLEIKTSFGYTTINMRAISTNPLSAQFPTPTAQSSAAFSNSSFQNWIAEPQLHWKPHLNAHRFHVIIGASWLDQTSEAFAQSGSGFTSEALIKNLAAAPTRTLGTNNYTQYRYQAFFGRANYTLKDRYILNLTARRDGSSRFGPGRQFAVFGAVGAAWIFSDEKWIKQTLSFISFGKLRASYGTTGNDQLGDYQYLDTYSSSSGMYQDIIGLQPDRLSNPQYGWEKNSKAEVALVIGLWNDRLMTSFSHYQNRSSSQLVGYPLPATTGFNNIQGNFPATVQNTGVEIELSSRNLQQTNFTWSTSINLSLPKNKLLKFPNIESFPAYANTYVVGEPLSIRMLYNYTGIDPTTGMYTFEDVNNDGQFTVEDRKVVRFVGQDFFGGLLNSFTYKGFHLDVFFQFVKQTGVNFTAIMGVPGSMVNVPEFVMARWQLEGDQQPFQRFTTTGTALTAYSRYATSQQSIGDASFVRLKNLSLSYEFPVQWVKAAHLDKVRIYIQGQNLFLYTKYNGMDPETRTAQLPPLRFITAGFQLTF